MVVGARKSIYFEKNGRGWLTDTEDRSVRRKKNRFREGVRSRDVGRMGGTARHVSDSLRLWEESNGGEKGSLSSSH